MVTGHGRLERILRVWLPVAFFLVLALFPFYWMAITSLKPNAELYNKNVMPLIVHAPTLKHYVDLLTKTSFLVWTWNTMLVALFPFYWMAITSLKPNAELYNKNVMPLIVHAPTLKHYVDLLTKTSFLVWTWNTMLVALIATFISLVLGVMLAYPLARMRFAGAGLIAMTVAAIYLVPQPLLFIPLADVINRLGLGNTLTSVILTYPTMLIPFCAWLLLGYFKTVPKELEEAARIDGASRLQTMRQIFLPLCTPGFISAGIFAFTLSQNEFLYALIFLTKTTVRTVPVGVISELIRGDVFYWGQLMAGALLGSIPVALIYSFFVEHYVAGLTAGSVKG
jgi:multiple sugar transport system permease protein